MYFCLIPLCIKFLYAGGYGDSDYKEFLQYKKNCTKNVVGKHRLQAPFTKTLKAQNDIDDRNPLIQHGKGTTKQLVKTSRFASSNVVPLIASLSIPDTEPLLNILRSGYALLETKISSAVSDSLSQIQTEVNNFTETLGTDIEYLIMQGNLDIQTCIINEFNDTFANVAIDIAQITASENSATSGNLSTENNALVSQINQSLVDSVYAVESTVNTGLTGVIASINAALRDANDNVLVNITSLLADADSKSPILPKFKYADSEVIKEIIKADSKAVFEGIQSLLNLALENIEGCVKSTANSAVLAETPILTDNNDAILTAINTRLNTALVNIQACLDNVSKDEIQNITNLINHSSSALSDVIESILSNLSPVLSSIVHDATETQVTELTALITNSNENILAQVGTILATA